MDVNETDMGMCVDSSCMRIVEAYDKIFKSGRIDHIEVFTMVQLKVWSWITLKVHLACFSYSDWCLNPLVCMKSIKKN